MLILHLVGTLLGNSTIENIRGISDITNKCYYKPMLRDQALLVTLIYPHERDTVFVSFGERHLSVCEIFL